MTSPFEKIVLPNGVRLILVPMPGVSSVATSVMVAVGSRYETPAINGISHFLEHMVFKGTRKYPTTDDVNIVERYGGLQNAYTDVDITSYHNKILSEDWQLGLEVNKELALYPLLADEHVERERNVILEEMKRYDDEPEARVGEAYHDLLYGGTRLGLRTIGTKESLSTLQGVSLQGYHSNFYRPERMVVVVAGDGRQVTSVQMRKKMEEYFADYKSPFLDNMSDLGVGLEKITERQDSPVVRFVIMPQIQQAHLVLGWRTFARGSEDRFAWNIFNLLMGVSFTSRLFRQIREKRGLCYHIRSSSSNYEDVGSWGIYAGVATDKVEEALGAIRDELVKVREEGVSEEEINIAKKRLKTLLAFRAEDPEFLNEYYGRQEVFGMPIMTLAEYLQKIAAVGRDEVNQLIRKYLRTSTANMAVVWNRPGKKSLDKFDKLVELD